MHAGLHFACRWAYTRTHAQDTAALRRAPAAPPHLITRAATHRLLLGTPLPHACLLFGCCPACWDCACISLYTEQTCTYTFGWLCMPFCLPHYLCHALFCRKTALRFACCNGTHLAFISRSGDILILSLLYRHFLWHGGSSIPVGTSPRTVRARIRALDSAFALCLPLAAPWLIPGSGLSRTVHGSTLLTLTLSSSPLLSLSLHPFSPLTLGSSPLLSISIIGIHQIINASCHLYESPGNS